jgi:hypothetical protein
MGISRMYTGGDGETHIEDWHLEFHPELTTLLAARSNGRLNRRGLPILERISTT